MWAEMLMMLRPSVEGDMWLGIYRRSREDAQVGIQFATPIEYHVLLITQILLIYMDFE